VYQNEILASSANVPSLIFDYLGTTQEDVQVCDPAPVIFAPSPVCASSTGNVASVPANLSATFSWSITNGTITNSSTGTVDHVTIGSGGSGFVSAPTVTISGGGGSGATATATVSGGAVTTVTITNPGSGYTSTPSVSFGGPGSGATAAATLGTGIIYTASTTSPITINLTVTQGTCSVSSTPASVTVNASSILTTDIASKNVCPGNTLTLSPAFTGASTFQWQVSTNGGISFSTLSNSAGGCTTNCVSGATTTTLTITNVQVAIDSNVYELIATNGTCSTPTSAATLHVTCALDLELTTNSASPSPVNAGSNVTYTQKISNLSGNPTTQPLTVWQAIPANTTFVSMTPPAGWACATATGVTTIAVNAGGSGYTTAPMISFTGGGGGSGATAIANVSGGVLVSITVTKPGSSYTSAPAVVITPVGGGSGASATATTGQVDTCTTSNVLAANSSTTNFTFVVTVNASTADGATITDTATVAVTAPDTDSVAANNFKTVTTPVQRRIDVAVLKTDDAFNSLYGNGFIYPGNPSTPQPLTWTVLVYNLGPSEGSGVTITDPMPTGFTYASSTTSQGNCSYSSLSTILTCPLGTLDSTRPAVTFSGGGGSGAIASAAVNGSGVVTAISVVNGGNGYTSAPTVTITGTGSGATATATVSGGAVTGIAVNTGGSGYSSLAPVSITISGTTSIDTALITNTTTATYNETDTNTANDSGTANVAVLAPTVVKILTMAGTQSKNKVTLTWQTSYEQDNLGFNIWRQPAGGASQKANAHIIAGSALFTGKRIDAGTGRSYRFVDSAAPAGQFVQYWIEDIDLKGVHTMHGPITPNLAASGTSSGTVTDPDPGVGSVGGIFTTAPGMGVTPATPSAPAATRLAQQWRIVANAGAKLIVTGPGWVRVKKSDLMAAGFDPGTDSHAISVFADGIEVPILIPSGSFGTNDTIEFYATGIDTPTAGGHVYYVTNGNKGTALRVKSSTAKGGKSGAAASYPYRFDRTERTVYYAALTNNGDHENFFGAIVTTYPVSEALTVANLDPQGSNAQVELVLQGVNDNFDHGVSATLNGHELGPIYFRSQARNVTDVTVPLNWLVAGENDLTFTATGGDDDVSLVETAHITYPHLYRADSDALAFTTSGATAVTVTGFTNAQIRAVDLTDPQNPAMLNVTVTTASDGTSSAAIVLPDGTARTVLALADDRVAPPAQVVYNAPSAWNAATNAGSLVIVTNSAFLSAANSLKATRDAQGIKTAVVDVQNLYDEFSYGAHGPYAIRTFLQRATSSWATPPRWAILMGDASIDPRNYLGIASTDFVPTKLIPTYYLKTASDDWFADFNDTAMPALPIGRIPVRTADEANAVIGKLVRRASTPPSGAWSNRVELVAGWASDVPFVQGASQLAALVPAPLTTDTISFSGTPNPAAAVVNAFNNGSLLTNYLGHGSIEIWSDLFSSADAAALTNGDQLPFVVTMDCLSGYFDDPYTEAVAKALLVNPGGGAIGVWASSTLTSPDQQLLVNLELYRQLFGSSSLTIGEAALKAKLATRDRDVRMAFILFGDPSMKLK
jgi:uncharacterized repeat protein (TIGR01451 family)